MSDDKNCWVPPSVPDLAVIVTAVKNESSGRQPIDFEGDWDSVVVEHKQIGYQENGFRVWLTDAQITKLIEARNRIRSAPGYERPDVPYFRAHATKGSGLLVRRLNGIEQVGHLTDAGDWVRV